jgi:predicted Zn-dependent protease
MLVLTLPAHAQLGQIRGRIGQAKEAVDKVNRAVQDLKFTEAEERQLGADVSAKLRERYGVVQDAGVHKYVTLVGAVVARNSSRADLPWTFIVLDTDAVNAFAAPGGFVHITRGALALMQDEAELAGVLAHEIIHVMSRHTIRAIQKGKVEGALAKAATRSAFLEGLGNRLYAVTLENSFDRGEEMESDRFGAALANDAGYHPAGLVAFLNHLADRNKAVQERSGVFASHPETKARTEELARIIKIQRLTNTALVQARYAASIPYKPVPIAQVVPGSAAAPAGAAAPARAGGSGNYGVAGLSSLGRENSSGSTIASAGSRGVNPDRDARGGPNKALVVVTVSPEEIALFRKGIA